MGPPVNVNADFSQIMDGYLLSSDFKNLCKALGFSNIDSELIKSNVANSLNVFPDVEENIANEIFFKITSLEKKFSDEIVDENQLIKKIDDYYFEAYVWGDEWALIKSKLIRDIKTGKIDSYYLLDKGFYKTLNSTRPFTDSILSGSHIKQTALRNILLEEIRYFLKGTDYSQDKRNYISKMLISEFRTDSLYFDKIEKRYLELSQTEKVSENIFDEYVQLTPPYDSRDLKSVVMTTPTTPEFIDLLLSLNLDMFREDEIRRDIENGQSVMKAIYNAYKKDNQISPQEYYSGGLKGDVRPYYYKSILYFQQDNWDRISKYLNEKIDSEQIKSPLDLDNEFVKFSDVSEDIMMRGDLIYHQILTFLDFRELKTEDYFRDFAFKIRENSILDYNLVKYLDEINVSKDNTIKQKPYLDEGKYPAPRWLFFPQYPNFSELLMYVDNVAYYNGLADNSYLFEKPKQFMINENEVGSDEKIPFRVMKWTPDGKPKYSKITDDYEIVNTFITPDQFDNPIGFNGLEYYTIKQAMVVCKVAYFNKFLFTKEQVNTSWDYEYSDEENKKWEEYKYTVLLNSTYYKFMQDRYLMEKLLLTGDKTLIFRSDDEYGCDENLSGKNLFGFALMEVRDEIKRLYAHQNQIDWQYSQYLKNRRVFNPFENKSRYSYMAFELTYRNLNSYVCDLDLENDDYCVGDIIELPEGFKAGDIMGGISKTHRITILSNHMSDFRKSEDKVEYGFHQESKFKVLDEYSFKGKTQILLLHIADGYDHYFDEDFSYDEELIELSRKIFERSLSLPPVEVIK